MEIKKRSYERNSSRTASAVLMILGVVCAIGATVTALLQFDRVSLWAVLCLSSLIILLSIATLVLSLLAVFAEPRLTTASAILTGVLQTVTLALCLYVASNGTLFGYLPGELVVPLVIGAVAIFAGVWSAFIVMRAKASAKPECKRGFRATAIVLAVIVCLLFGVEIASGILGQNKLFAIKEYYGEVTTPYQQFKADNDIAEGEVQSVQWYGNETYSTEYGREQVEYLAVFDTSNYVNASILTDTSPIDYVDAGNKAIAYFRQQGFLSASENPVITQSLSSVDGQSNDKIIVVNDTWDGYYVALAIKLKTYKTEVKTAMDVFHEEFPNVNLSRSKSFALDNDPEQPNSDMYLRVGRVRSQLRIPNVCLGVALLFGVIALWTLTLCCSVVETAVEVTRAKTRSDLKAIARQNVPLNIFLTLITLGIYGFVWFYRNAKNVRYVNGDQSAGCGDEVFLSVIAGPVYNVYWYYTRAKQLQADVNGFGCSKYFYSPARYLLLSVFTGGLFTLAVMATQFNKLIEEENVEPVVLDDNATVTLADRRSIIKAFFLGLITLGIYWLITIAVIANRVKILQGKRTASTSQLVCLMLVPFYWIFWLVKNRGQYREGSNEATLETWLIFVVPMYSVYFLLSRTDELRVYAEQFGVTIADEPVWTTLLAVFVPMLAYALMMFNLNKVAGHAQSKL